MAQNSRTRNLESDEIRARRAEEARQRLKSHFVESAEDQFMAAHSPGWEGASERNRKSQERER